MNSQRQKHWETVYETRQPSALSWTQEVPQPSLGIIASLNLPKSAAIIDIGGGDSRLVDYLLQQGYQDITVMDISGTAIDRAKRRLGDKADNIKWVVADITEFQPRRQYDVWHDRAVFHFLTTPEDIYKYSRIAAACVIQYLIIGTFSTSGPKKCSGLDVQQYNDVLLNNVFQQDFEKIDCFTTDHTTPSGSLQNFIFCTFRKKMMSALPDPEHRCESQQEN